MVGRLFTSAIYSRYVAVLATSTTGGSEGHGGNNPDGVNQYKVKRTSQVDQLTDPWTVEVVAEVVM